VTDPGRLSADFWKFWAGQTISNLGSSFTQWAVPLLVYKLTHSALSLGVATAATFLPYLLFGLLLGAWMDRVDRKKAMIALDLVNGLVILSIPLVATFGHLSVSLIYAVAFVQTAARRPHGRVHVDPMGDGVRLGVIRDLRDLPVAHRS
jgi:MFS family permease